MTLADARHQTKSKIKGGQSGNNREKRKRRGKDLQYKQRQQPKQHNAKNNHLQGERPTKTYLIKNNYILRTKKQTTKDGQRASKRAGACLLPPHYKNTNKKRTQKEKGKKENDKQ